MSGTDADDVASIAPLADVAGESPSEREARLLAHIGRYMQAHNLTIRTDLGNQIARLGDRMDAALDHLGRDIAAEVRDRRDEDRRLDDAVREIPSQIISLQETVIREIQRSRPSGSTPAPPPGPALATLVQTSKPVQALVLAGALLMAAGAVGVLSLAIGPEGAAEVVDKLPRYEIRSESPAQPAPVLPQPPQPE